jgi:hypothetical protein
LAAVFLEGLPDKQSRKLVDIFKAEVARVFGAGHQEMNTQSTRDDIQIRSNETVMKEAFDLGKKMAGE